MRRYIWQTIWLLDITNLVYVWYFQKSDVDVAIAKRTSKLIPDVYPPLWFYGHDPADPLLHHKEHIEAFHKWGYPKWMVYHQENPWKYDLNWIILGYPPIFHTSIYSFHSQHGAVNTSSKFIPTKIIQVGCTNEVGELRFKAIPPSVSASCLGHEFMDGCGTSASIPTKPTKKAKGKQ